MAMPLIETGTERRKRVLSAPALAGLAIAAVAVLGALDLLIDPMRIVAALGDSDDATRLIEVRGLMAGAPWFDTTLKSLGAPDPLVSHWSRLVDLPLALLIRMLTPLLGSAGAETATRYFWPLLVLAPLVAMIASEARRRAGDAAAMAAVIVTMTSLSGLVQFLPGRIDHHNCMILASVAGIAMTARAFDDPRCGWLAGGAFGIGLAIGYEPLALVAPGIAVAALLALVTGRGIEGMARLALALTATLLLALLVTTAPSRLFMSHCDALSINIVHLCAGGAAGLGLVAARGRAWPVWLRLAVPAAFGAVGVALYALAEPACLKGPFGEIDPAVKPIWLDEVVESKSIFWLAERSPGGVLTFALFMAIALVAAWKLRQSRRDIDLSYRLGMVAFACLLAAWQIKLMPYATFLAVLPIAAVIARETSTLRQVGAVALANQLTLAVLSAPLASTLVTVPAASAAWQATVRKCLATDAVKPLAALPAGLVLAQTDLGPFIAALTPQRAVSGPYHRLDKAIVATHQLLEGSLADGEQRLRALGADYVAICPGLRIDASPAWTDGLGPFEAQLTLGRTPDYLEPVTLPAATPIKVWRVLKPSVDRRPQRG